jgi:type IV fimbrial biogenesis protein FimT
MMKYFRKTDGFTMLEILTVLVIIGIIAAMAMPQFDTTVKKVRFKSASNTILSGLRLARSSAISERAQYGVNVDGTNNMISVFKDLSSPGTFSFDPQDSVIFEDSLSRGIETLGSDFVNDLVFFFPDGTASSSGNIYGYSSFTPTLQANMQISVLASTGRVRIDSLYY